MLFTFLTTNTYLEHLLSFVPSSLVLALLIVGVSNRTSQDNHGLIKVHFRTDDEELMR